MCQRITCRTCGKPSFAGCGRHVESVLGDVPVAARCRCRESSTTAGAADRGPGVMKRLLGFMGGGRDAKER